MQVKVAYEKSSIVHSRIADITVGVEEGKAGKGQNNFSVTLVHIN